MLEQVYCPSFPSTWFGNMLHSVALRWQQRRGSVQSKKWFFSIFSGTMKVGELRLTYVKASIMPVILIYTFWSYVAWYEDGVSLNTENWPNFTSENRPNFMFFPHIFKNKTLWKFPSIYICVLMLTNQMECINTGCVHSFWENHEIIWRYWSEKMIPASLFWLSLMFWLVSNFEITQQYGVDLLLNVTQMP